MSRTVTFDCVNCGRRLTVCMVGQMAQCDHCGTRMRFDPRFLPDSAPADSPIEGAKEPMIFVPLSFILIVGIYLMMKVLAWTLQ